MEALGFTPVNQNYNPTPGQIHGVAFDETTPVGKALDTYLNFGNYLRYDMTEPQRQALTWGQNPISGTNTYSNNAGTGLYDSAGRERYNSAYLWYAQGLGSYLPESTQNTLNAFSNLSREEMNKYNLFGAGPETDTLVNAQYQGTQSANARNQSVLHDLGFDVNTTDVQPQVEQPSGSVTLSPGDPSAQGYDPGALYNQMQQNLQAVINQPTPIAETPTFPTESPETASAEPGTLPAGGPNMQITAPVGSTPTASVAQLPGGTYASHPQPAPPPGFQAANSPNNLPADEGNFGINLNYGAGIAQNAYQAAMNQQASLNNYGLSPTGGAWLGKK
jgi:hypothetical protein